MTIYINLPTSEVIILVIFYIFPRKNWLSNWGQNVFLAASFNGWKDQIPMVRSGQEFSVVQELPRGSVRMETAWLICSHPYVIYKAHWDKYIGIIYLFDLEFKGISCWYCGYLRNIVDVFFELVDANSCLSLLLSAIDEVAE